MELKWYYSGRGHFVMDLIAEFHSWTGWKIVMLVNMERSQANVCGSRTYPRFLQISNQFQADIAFMLMYICIICSIFSVILTEYWKWLNNREQKHLTEMGNILDVSLENYLNWHQTKLSGCKVFWKIWLKVWN